MIRILVASILVAAAVAAIPYSAFADNARDAGGLAALHRLGLEDGRLCMSDHPHFGQTGTWPTLEAAKLSAVQSWSGFTRIEYGDDWADFRIAADQKFNCSPARSAYDSSWTCNVEARPCTR